MNRTIAVLPSLSAPVMNPLKVDGVRTVVPSTSALPAACAYGRTGRSFVFVGIFDAFFDGGFRQTNALALGRWSARS
jgi:hypothetical protein